MYRYPQYFDRLYEILTFAQEQVLESGAIDIDQSPQDLFGDIEYLSYPTPNNLQASTDLQMIDSGDLRNVFGWVFPEWD
jgi:hypothetical protein